MFLLFSLKDIVHRKVGVCSIMTISSEEETEALCMSISVTTITNFWIFAMEVFFCALVCASCLMDIVWKPWINIQYFDVNFRIIAVQGMLPAHCFFPHSFPMPITSNVSFLTSLWYFSPTNVFINCYGFHLWLCDTHEIKQPSWHGYMW